MKQSDLLDRMGGIFEDCRDLAERKNSDYAGNDALENLRQFGTLGIVVRLSDKFARIKNLVQKEPSVKDEKLEDTLMDIINYAALAIIMNEENKELELPF